MYPQKATPLIIVGRQRSGTRFLTDVLNSFEGVAIQGELPNPVMLSAVQMIGDIEAYYAKMAATGDPRDRRHYRTWKKKSEDLIFSIWENASQTARVKFDADVKYFGYKRPNNEFYFDFYEASFRFRSPVYVYCTRRFADNYLSIGSRWPERSIEQVASEYLESTAQYRHMSAGAPGRVLLFVLDDYVRHGFQYIADCIIDPLGLRLTQSHRRRIEQMRAKNRTEEDLKLVRRRNLTAEEQHFIRTHPELDEEFEKLRFSYSVNDVHRA